jgi:hypothetical protein
MMFDYLYTRDWLPAKNHWDIGYNNPSAEPTPIVEPSLNDEIFASAIAQKNIVRCSNGECRIFFEVELTPEEIGTLDTVVATHKSNAAA